MTDTWDVIAKRLRTEPPDRVLMLKGAIVIEALAEELASAAPAPAAGEPVSAEMLRAAMRAFEPMSSVLRYREKDGWHACDQMAMRAAIEAALKASHPSEAIAAMTAKLTAAEARIEEMERENNKMARDYNETRAKSDAVDADFAFIEHTARSSRYGVTIEWVVGAEGEAYGFSFGRQRYIGPPHKTAREAVQRARSDLARRALSQEPSNVE